MPTFPTYYEDYASVSPEQYTAAGRCVLDGADHYYQFQARSNDDPDQGKARRGVIGRVGCCGECEACGCFCNSAWIIGASSDPRRDASFDSPGDPPDPYAPVYVTFAGLERCDLSELYPGSLTSAEALFQEIEDCAENVGINGRWTIPWDQYDGDYCRWRLAEEYECEVAGSTATVTLWISAALNRVTGVWTVGAVMTGLPDSLSFFGGTGYNTWYCSDGQSDEIFQSLTECPEPASPTLYVYVGGSATVDWGTESLATPDYYVAKFTGNLVACENCTEKEVVAEAIVAAKDPAGWVLRNNSTSGCRWSSPYIPVKDTQGAYATGTITLGGQPSDGDTITIHDGKKSVTFEFDDDDSVTAPNVEVNIGPSKEETAANLVAQINLSLDVVAVAPSPADGSLTLRNERIGEDGNEDITSVGSNITTEGMTGGVESADNSGWFWAAIVSLHASGLDTEWRVSLLVKDFRHGRDQGSVGGVPGVKYYCAYDTDSHTIFYDSKVVAEASQNCNSPPSLSNDQDCDADGHSHPSGQGAGDVKTYASCGEGGTCTLTAG